MFDVEYVDPADSKCTECGCSFDIHLKTCSHFVDPHKPRHPVLLSATCVINVASASLVAEASAAGRYLYIGRPGKGVSGKWGNDWSHIPTSHAKHHVKTLGEALRNFEDWLPSSPLWNDLEQLRGKVLGCFCASRGRILTADRPWVCHGQIYCYYLDILKG